MAANTYRRRLSDAAVDQYGYVTAAMAKDLGIPPVELRKLAQRGFLDRIARGLYRFPDVPPTPFDEYMEAVLWVGPDAALSHDAVLALHDLAFVAPRTIRVVTPHRVRKSAAQLPVTIIRDTLPGKDLTVYEGIPSTTVARALQDCRELVMVSRLREAADHALQRGLLLADEHVHVRRVLDSP